MNLPPARSGGRGRGGRDKSGRGARGPSGRNLAQRVRTTGRRSHSSILWLERQLNDPYVAQAKRDGYRSRAAYKFLEMDDRYKLLKPGQKIVDLGAAPGGWSQIAAKRVQSAEGRGKVVGIDLLDIEPIAGVDFEVMDFLDDAAPEKLKEMLGGFEYFAREGHPVEGEQATRHVRDATGLVVVVE